MIYFTDKRPYDEDEINFINQFFQITKKSQNPITPPLKPHQGIPMYSYE